jgi:PKD repeat protein
MVLPFGRKQVLSGAMSPNPTPASPTPGRRRHRGQSLVELALILPVLLLLTLVAIDFGRVYLGWVNLQQMTRIAASFAADHAMAWDTPGDQAQQDRYYQKIVNDAQAINCALPPEASFPQPTFTGGTALGAHVTVAISCQFSIITPIVSDILGGTILVTAETTYPVKEGAIASGTGGGAPITLPPVADFIASPRTGWAPLAVTLTDTSIGGPSSWTWDFSVSATGTNGATPSVNQWTALDQGPYTITYDCAGQPGDTCSFGVALSVSNPGGSDSTTRADHIVVTVPPADGPIAEFTGTPTSGVQPLSVAFDFVDLRAGAVTYVDYAWDFGDGATGNGASITHTYAAEDTYDVTLTVRDDTGATNQLIKVGYITVSHEICRVPDFANKKKNNAQAIWAAANFTTQVQFRSGQGNYDIRYQSLVGGTIDPQPDGCDSVIEVGP